jgi:hypothetical protein
MFASAPSAGHPRFIPRKTPFATDVSCSAAVDATSHRLLPGSDRQHSPQYPAQFGFGIGR